MIFAGGAKGSPKHKAAHHKAQEKATYFIDTANKYFDIRDTLEHPTL